MMGNSSTASAGGTNSSFNGSLGVAAFGFGSFWPFPFSLWRFSEALTHCHVTSGDVGWLGFKIFILLTAFPANVGLMWLLLRRRTAMTASELLGINVAAMDVLYGAVLPLDVYTALHRGSETQHAVREALFAFNTFGCPLLLTCMCVERYLAVAWPVTYLRLGGRSYRLVLCGVVWTLTLAVVLLGFLARMFTVTLCLSAVLSLLFLLMLLSLLGMVRVLRRVGPGDGAGTTLKRRALKNIVAVTVPSVAAYCPVVALVPYMLVVCRRSQQLSAANCSVINLLLLFPNLGLFIGPMFYLARVRQDAVEPKEVVPPGQSLSPVGSLGSQPSVTKGQQTLMTVSASSATVGGEEADQQQRLVRTQESRRRLLAEVCAKHQVGVAQQVVSPQQVSRIYVEDRSRLLYCEVPKAGCTNWKRVLMVLAGTASSVQSSSIYSVHYANHLRRLVSYDSNGIAQRLRSYTKVLFVREPLERLVSAYRDKFENPNSYYHSLFGRAIISRYRANATQTARSTGDGVTFREFIQYLLDKRKPVGMDVHWQSASELCHPCLLHYDFIGRVEDMEEEANFLLRKIGAPANLTFPTSKNQNPQDENASSRITQKYFSQLNATERQGAYDFYNRDYLLFQYPKPFQDLH